MNLYVPLGKDHVELLFLFSVVVHMLPKEVLAFCFESWWLFPFYSKPHKAIGPSWWQKLPQITGPTPSPTHNWCSINIPSLVCCLWFCAIFSSCQHLCIFCSKPSSMHQGCTQWGKIHTHHVKWNQPFTLTLKMHFYNSSNLR